MVESQKRDLEGKGNKMCRNVFLLSIVLLISTSVMGAEITERRERIQEKRNAVEAKIDLSSSQYWEDNLLDQFLVKRTQQFRVRAEVSKGLPPEFDWRDRDGHFWMTPIKDQAGSGLTFIYAVVGALEANIKISAKNPWITPYFCELDSIPYWRISESGWTNPAVDSIKAAIYSGPVAVQFEVYEDFFGYPGGVYEHVTGLCQGEHSVTMLGWSDTDSCWICKNSWGPSWGENGWFRIKYGQCQIESGGSYWLVPVNWGRDGAIVKEKNYYYELQAGSVVVDTLLIFNTFPTDQIFFVFEIINHPAWITPMISSDTLYGGNSVYVEFEVNSLGLEGNYVETLKVEISDSQGEAPEQWPVQFELDVNVTFAERSNDSSLPAEFAMRQNYPNPFNAATSIGYAIPVDCHVRLEIYNLLGQKITVLVDEQQQVGRKTVRWDARSFTSGVYLYRLQAGDFVQARKMVLLK